MNTRCFHATNSISIHSNGKITQCCSAGTIPKVTLFNDIDDIINSQYMISLRNDLNNDVRHKSCKQCWDTEDAGGKSFRRHSIELAEMYGINQTPKSNITYDDVYWLDIFMGNKCNLACRMCTPNSSSLVGKHTYKFYHGDNVIIPDTIESSFSDSTRDKTFEIIEKSTNLKFIHLYGGEPLLIKFHDELCEYLIEKDRAKDIELRFSSNLQADISRKIKYHQYFKKITISISIDGSSETYEYIRWPGKWNKIKKNIQLLNDATDISYDASVTLVLQNLNVDNMYDFFTEIQEVYKNPIFVAPVWGTNKIEILPTRILEEQLKKLDNIKGPLRGTEQVINLLNHSIELSKNLNPDDVFAFFNKQKMHDTYQNQNLFTIKPHFIELAEQFNYKIW